MLSMLQRSVSVLLWRLGSSHIVWRIQCGKSASISICMPYIPHRPYICMFWHPSALCGICARSGHCVNEALPVWWQWSDPRWKNEPFRHTDPVGVSLFYSSLGPSVKCATRVQFLGPGQLSTAQSLMSFWILNILIICYHFCASSLL